MKIKFARFSSLLDLDAGHVLTLEVVERTLFARIVMSLTSELGEKAIEPYFMFDGERSVAPRGKLLFLDNLPELPLRDRAFEKALYEKLAEEVADMPGLEQGMQEIEARGRTLSDDIRSRSLGMWGTYDFEVHWDLMAYLKAFGFGVRLDGSETFLERCISFFGLCVDIGFNKPLVAINLKSFLSKNELEKLFGQAIFHGIHLVLLESWKDENVYDSERKIRIEQGLLEF